MADGEREVYRKGHERVSRWMPSVMVRSSALVMSLIGPSALLPEALQKIVLTAIDGAHQGPIIIGKSETESECWLRINHPHVYMYGIVDHRIGDCQNVFVASAKSRSQMEKCDVNGGGGES